MSATTGLTTGSDFPRPTSPPATAPTDDSASFSSLSSTWDEPPPPARYEIYEHLGPARCTACVRTDRRCFTAKVRFKPYRRCLRSHEHMSLLGNPLTDPLGNRIVYQVAVMGGKQGVGQRCIDCYAKGRDNEGGRAGERRCYWIESARKGEEMLTDRVGGCLRCLWDGKKCLLGESVEEAKERHGARGDKTSGEERNREVEALLG